MKLPENKQERTKVFIMIGLGVILVVLGIVQGIINPLRHSRQAKLARVEECRSDIKKAGNDIRAAARSFAKRMDTLTEIQQISEQYILHPVLGNYLLQATEIIEKEAKKLGIEIDPVREVGISDIPADKKNKERLLKAYTVRVTLLGAYRDALSLIRELEQGNPYICVTSLVIRPRPTEDVEKHNVTIEVQWPVWADPNFPTEIDEQLKEQGSEQEGKDA